MQVNRHGKTYTAPKPILVFLPHCLHCHVSEFAFCQMRSCTGLVYLMPSLTESYMTTKLDCNLVPTDTYAGEKNQHVR